MTDDEMLNPCVTNNVSRKYFWYIQANSDRTPVEEMKAAEERGAFAYQPPRTGEDGEHFEDARETSPRMQVGWDEVIKKTHPCNKK